MLRENFSDKFHDSKKYDNTKILHYTQNYIYINTIHKIHCHVYFFYEIIKTCIRTITKINM